ADYSQPVGPIRAEMRPSASLLESLTGDLDVAGMPVVLHDVMVMDARPVNKFTDKIKTSLLAEGSKEIPSVDEDVRLTLVSFAQFTKITPPAATGATVAPNPMIGPNPFDSNDRTPAPEARFNGKTVKLTMLLDTGAVTSMISKRVAKELGVTYSADGSTLIGVPKDQQFSLAIGGIGGQKTSLGFYLDCLQIPTDQTKPLQYFKAPVLVSDISVRDSKTGQTFTLDGVFGMNYLVASTAITGGLIPDIGKMVQGPFSYIVIDPDHGTLGLKENEKLNH
ncbi:MAG TPA: aspartyl protease family protein, partial [Tepidisphaeraceae bacterium]|nr:aspartyl protease family protein [Tepidisphaeraceae bacterium]